MFARFVVLLDQLATQAGAFACVRDWQQQVHLPVQVVVTPGHEQPFATVCKWLGCRPEIAVLPDAQTRTLWQSLHPDDLLLLGPGVPQSERNWVLQHLAEPGSPAVLVCPDHCRPLERVLVCDQGGRSSARFLRQAVTIARSLHAAPIVLTVAPTEQAARSRQCQARMALAEESMGVDFDFVVGSQQGPAVAHVARWRHAQLVIVEPPHLSSWQRWFRGNPLARFLDGLDALAMLALPGASQRDRLPSLRAAMQRQGRS